MGHPNCQNLDYFTLVSTGLSVDHQASKFELFPNSLELIFSNLLVGVQAGSSIQSFFTISYKRIKTSQMHSVINGCSLSSV